MKKVILLLISIFMVISCGKTVKDNNNKLSKKDTNILSLLPQDTQGLINIKSIKSVFENFKITENTVFGKAFEEKDFDTIKKVLSINPLNLKDLNKIGIDTNKELGIAFNQIIMKENGDDLSSLNTIVYIPLKNDKKILSFIENSFKDGKLNNSKEFTLNLKKEKNYLKISGKQKEEVIYIFVKNNYLFIIFNPINTNNSLTLTKNILNNKSSMNNSEVFKQSKKSTQINEGIYLYVNLKDFIKKNEKVIKEQFGNSDLAFNLIKAYKTLSMQLALDSKDFSLKIMSLLDNTSKIFKIFKNIKYNNSSILGLDKPALSLLSFGLNIEEYIKLIKVFANEYFKKYNNIASNKDTKTVDEKMNEEIQKLNQKFGFDFEKDLINNFNGNFNYGIYDGMSISTTNYNTVVTIGFKDLKVIETVIDKILENKYSDKIRNFVNKTTYNDKTIYIINAMITQVYVGFNKNELVVASSKEMYDALLNSKKDTGFYKYSSKDSKLSKASRSDMIFYISFPEIINALNNFKSMIPANNLEKIIKTMDLLDYFLVNASFNDDGFLGRYSIKTKSDKLFFVTLIEYIESMTNKK